MFRGFLATRIEATVGDSVYASPDVRLADTVSRSFRVVGAARCLEIARYTVVFRFGPLADRRPPGAIAGIGAPGFLAAGRLAVGRPAVRRLRC
ncbi:MAG TPA: hypothetical protein VMG99_05000 [Thermoplasmata archaeon]|nr:hypothetical protein [Thermoplasmata archaeon]